MKELSTEQKAKRYNEVLEKARKELQTCGSTDCEAARQIFRFFPELKESEDEKIRKELIDFVKSRLAGFPQCEKFISWLEKQGEKDKLIQELGEYKVKYIQETLGKALTMNNKDDERLRKTTIAFLKEFADKGYENAIECIDWLEKQGEKPQGKSALEAIKEEKVDNQNCIEPADKVKPKFKHGDRVKNKKSGVTQILGSCIEDVYEGAFPFRIKEQDNWELVEQKPSNKVEPKFHVGEWITDGNITIQIEAIKNDCYLYCGDCILYSTKIADKVYHLWTIEDAKDGDVLCSEQIILLFKKWEDNNYYSFVIAHAGIDVSGKLQITNEHWLISNKSKPATKEQRDILFAKIIEAGYEWDADKKELKRIVITDLVKDCITPKPAEWSKDDEQYLLVCKNALRKYQVTDKWDSNIISQWLDYKLKSLRPQKQWKPSDEQIDALQYVYRNYNPLPSDKLGWDSIKTIELMYQELKKLREE